MKCEICHQNEAAAVIHVKTNGEKKELFVCKACATKAKHPAKRNSSRRQDAVLALDDEEPPEFVKNLVEATLGFMKGVVESKHHAHQKCPACKKTWEQIKESRLVGCPTCWKTFAAEIRDVFLRGEYGPRHMGTMPPTVTGEASRAYIERELKAAVSREDFKKAAALKRQLDTLGGKEAS